MKQRKTLMCEDQYYYDERFKHFYRKKDKTILPKEVLLPLTPILVNPIRASLASTSQILEAAQYTMGISFKKMTSSAPLCSFQTNNHLNILTRTSFEIFKFENDNLVPLQSVGLPGEVFKYSISQTLPHLQLQNVFVLLVIVRGKMVLYEYLDGNIVKQTPLEKSVTTMCLADNDVVMTSKNYIQFSSTQQRVSLVGNITCVVYPYVSTSKGTLFKISNANNRIEQVTFATFERGILSFQLLDKFIVVQLSNLDVVVLNLLNKTTSIVKTPFKPTSFKVVKNYILMTSPSEFALALIDENGIVDYITHEKKELVNCIPLILFDEYDRPRVSFVGSQDIFVSF
ncbi:hypothetical protein EIN_054430 [Entamoeba invadens IP1]|uniref:hypothetical protein n=1 Tax=Entamoeba invadens IP1 TaxID=370355 RepID=UPI0002C3E39A|nr:hypothetical protein EIN_054430 [Entamoeba invadens IP1]ELP93158.1 hypothetical protein EIN_054430 [Entamoeba invadens IP1]|eukprot:XP_004259929.1 hypothetical protein EIN_054430 [Entamoeba invadens IP1]